MIERILLTVLVAVFVTGCSTHSDPALLGTKGGYYTSPVWSRDGNRFAFVLNEQLWLSNADGRGAKRITGGFLTARSSRVVTASWLPDGRIAYVEVKKGAKANLPRNTLLVYDPITKEKTILLDNLSTVYDLSWHPTSSATAVLVMNLSHDVLAPSEHAVFELVMETATLNQVHAIPAHRELSSARWLDGGEELAYVLDNTLSVWDRQTGHVRALPSDTKAVGHFAVAPDGKRIIYRRYAVRSSAMNKGTYLVPSDFSEPPAKISDEEMVRMDWSPDGKELIYTTVGFPGRNELRRFALPEAYVRD